MYFEFQLIYFLSFSSEEEEDDTSFMNESSEDCGVRGKFQSRPLTLPIATENFLQDGLHGSSAVSFVFVHRIS